MDHLMSRCPATGKAVDLQIEADGQSMARIWSSPLRFHCPHCGEKHETKVGEAYVENVLSLAREARA